MPKGTKICLAVVILIFAASAVTSFFLLRPTKRDSSTESVYVEIVQNNKVIYKLDLSKESDRTIRITSDDGGWNDVRIEKGQISVADADCPDHTCVKAGVLKYDYLPVVCLPHKLVIRFCGEQEAK